jgi:hypothetical protein
VLGLLERYHIACHDVGHDSCVIVAAKYAALAASGPILDKAALYPALEKVIHTHIALCVCLKDESTKKPFYAHLQHVDLDQVVAFVDHDDLTRAIEMEFSHPFDTSSMVPLWRLAVLKDGVVLFAFHHSICDGKSGAAFHTALITALNDPSPPKETISKVTVSSGELVPPIEKLVDLSISISKFVNLIWGLVARTSWNPGHPSWTANPVIETLHSRNNCRVLYFPPEETS